MGPSHGRIDPINPVVRDHPLNRGRLAWWIAATGLSGHVRQDMMGRYPATLATAQTVLGGWPFPMIRLSSYAVMTAPCSAGNLNRYTVGVRFTPTATSITGDHSLIVRQGTPGGYERAGAISWRSSSGGQVYTDTKTGYAAYAASPLTAGVETTFVLTVTNSTGSDTQFYQDGKPLATTRTITTPGDDTTGLPFTIGSRAGWYSTLAPIAEAFVYDRILSAEEIAQLEVQRRLGYPDLLRRYSSLRTYRPVTTFQPGWIGVQSTPGVGIY